MRNLIDKKHNRELDDSKTEDLEEIYTFRALRTRIFSMKQINEQINNKNNRMVNNRC